MPLPLSRIASHRERFRGAPLAPGCISLFVRGGDKAAESAVFSSQHYEGIVQRLRQIDPALTNQVRCCERAAMIRHVSVHRGSSQVTAVAALTVTCQVSASLICHASLQLCLYGCPCTWSCDHIPLCSNMLSHVYMLLSLLCCCCSCL